MLEQLKQVLIKLLEYTMIPMETPAMFGTFHGMVLLAGVPVCILLCWLFRRKQGRTQGKMLSVCGWILVVMEIYKQLFRWLVIGGGKYNWWYFPFQLCSMPMYLGILYPYLKTGTQQTIRSFLASYAFVGTVCALCYPQDMLHEYVFLTAHAFLWHFILLFMSLQIVFSRTGGKSINDFGRAVLLFAGLAVIAVGINVFGEQHVQIPGSYPNMFYLSFTHKTGQIGFRTIEELYGKAAEITAYLGTLTFVSWLVHGIMCRWKS